MIDPTVLLIAAFIGFLVGAAVNDYVRGDREVKQRLRIYELEWELECWRKYTPHEFENPDESDGRRY